nr:MAG TPA: hypothetical protein [Caudoviricetes sp.]
MILIFSHVAFSRFCDFTFVSVTLAPHIIAFI